MEILKVSRNLESVGLSVFSPLHNAFNLFRTPGAARLKKSQIVLKEPYFTRFLNFLTTKIVLIEDFRHHSRLPGYLYLHQIKTLFLYLDSSFYSSPNTVLVR